MPPHAPAEHMQLTIDKPVTSTPHFIKPPEKISYAFVDAVRFLATIGIVYIHTNVPMNGADSNAFMRQVPHAEIYLFIKQLFKFSTICYFLIAGFLLGDKGLTGSPFAYYMRRLNVIAKPYLLALALFVVAATAFGCYTSGQHFSLQFMRSVAEYVLLYSPFWYIPNYLLCLLVIVCFYKYASSVYFGGVLLLFTLANTWFSVYAGDNHSHTTALTGFIFYMWLGMYFKKNNIITYIKSLSPWVTGGLLLLTYIMSNAETWYMYSQTHIGEVLNTLRISNQLYSVAFFVFMVNVCNKPVNFGWLNPRKETYGIYLYHTFFVYIVMVALNSWFSNQFHISLLSYNVYHILLLNLFNFVVAYLATTVLVKVMLRFNLLWLPPL